MGIATSTIYGQGQSFSRSVDQGSTYLEYSYTNRIGFDSNFEVTTPIRPSLYRPTVSNYPQVDKSFFMGSFDGFWIHKLYVNDHMIASVQTVNQEFFVPIYHDRVESVSMGTVSLQPCVSDCDPGVPAPGALACVCIGTALLSRKRKR